MPSTSVLIVTITGSFSYVGEHGKAQRTLFVFSVKCHHYQQVDRLHFGRFLLISLYVEISPCSQYIDHVSTVFRWMSSGRGHRRLVLRPIFAGSSEFVINLIYESELYDSRCCYRGGIASILL